ncbi:hypothetical protein KW784_01065 [Candidatus Parcubacteria bacterium]|nr:hypothetical protein [Candidatus Parcubacteria bacterium]
MKADIFDQTALKYQIDASARRAPDASVEIGGRPFKKYDLTDYGSYGGESAGRVIVYVGPEIMVGGVAYLIVFHWEERPLTESLSGNDPALFESMVQSLTFLP